MDIYDLQMQMHADKHLWPEWGSEVRGDMIRPHWAHPGEDMGEVIGIDPATMKDRIYQVVRCAWCIACHVWPLPSTEALAQYYATVFYQKEKPDYLNRYEQDRLWWEHCVHRPLLARVESYLKPVARKRRILEVGAGPGIALDVAAEVWWWETTAIEPSPMCAHALRKRGHMVWEGTLESFGMPYGAAESYDILYLYEVAEHQNCPEEFLLRCYDLLSPGGLIVVAVPNDGNPLQYAVCDKLGITPYWYAPPQHLFYFTPKTLQLLLRRCGFTICDARSTYPMERFILDEGQNYLGNDAIGRKVHQWRMQEEMAVVTRGLWEEREAQYRANYAQRIGRELYMIARKEGA